MGMRQTSVVAPQGQIVHVWITRVTPTNTGARQTAFLSRWPATLSHIEKEQAVKMGYSGQTLHTLIGPAWKGKLVQAGDFVKRIIARDGVNFVHPAKPWMVISRAHDRGLGDIDGQNLIVKEEV